MINGTLLENKKEDLIMEQEKKYYKYRYNPACPNCKEEHIYYIVLIFYNLYDINMPRSYHI